MTLLSPRVSRFPRSFRLCQVLDWFSAKGLSAYSISCGPALLYNNIFPKHAERVGKRMSELVVSVAKVRGARGRVWTC